MDFKKLFRKKSCNFYELLGDQIKKTVEGIDTLKLYMEKPDHASAEALDKKEMEADELRRILIDELLRSFSTPIDREDIFSLSRAIDDIIDYATSTVDEMTLFKVAPDTHLMQMVEKLASGAREIMTAIERLERNPHVAGEHAVRAKRIENDVENIYRNAIVELFDGNDFIAILKKREIYRHLSNAADRCDEAANIIADIVVKSV
jgi:predicted phosphate transport protein (TIGR00153 family)